MRSLTKYVNLIRMYKKHVYFQYFVVPTSYRQKGFRGLDMHR